MRYTVVTKSQEAKLSLG